LDKALTNLPNHAMHEFRGTITTNGHDLIALYC
jgi:hypothetical protein